MKLVTIRTPDGTRAARVDGDDVVELPYADVRHLIADGPDWTRAAARSSGPRHRYSDVSLAPVIPVPEKIICLGRNYAEHVEELQRERPEYPVLFAKFHRSLIGARDAISLPPGGQVDWEAELVIVVGREVRHARGDEATSAIAGYTVMNDVSARDWQSRTTQWLQGKTFEGSTPLGPALVTSDEVGDPSRLEIRCEVNGEVMQRATCASMIFKPQEVVEYVSDIITLVPGDVIATGTPSGVGLARSPQVFLRPGDVVRTSVAGIGECVNVCAG
jgi:acylpyruvate hydrolase